MSLKTIHLACYWMRKKKKEWHDYVREEFHSWIWEQVSWLWLCPVDLKPATHQNHLGERIWNYQYLSLVPKASDIIHSSYNLDTGILRKFPNDFHMQPELRDTCSIFGDTHYVHPINFILWFLYSELKIPRTIAINTIQIL
jgi:hypothetical protein